MGSHTLLHSHPHNLSTSLLSFSSSRFSIPYERNEVPPNQLEHVPVGNAVRKGANCTPDLYQAVVLKLQLQLPHVVPPLTLCCEDAFCPCEVTQPADAEVVPLELLVCV